MPVERPSQPKVSAIIVAHGRPLLLGRCLDGLLEQTEPSFEVLVVLNGDNAEVTDAVAERARRDVRIRAIPSARTTASEARNYGADAARAPLLYFLDDDVEVPVHGFEAAVELFASQPHVAVAGGPNVTPPDDPDFAQMTGELFASPFGTGITHFRYTPRAEGPATERDLTLCNLVIEKRLFEAGVRFPQPFGGEENVLMGRASDLGHHFWYSPRLWVYHRRRSNLFAHVEQAHRYGFGRGIAIHGAPNTFHVAYFVPVAFTASLVVLPLAAWFGVRGASLPLLTYAALALAVSMRIAARRRKPAWFFALPWLFPVTHVAYALGLLRGLYRGYVHGDKRTAKSIASAG